MPSNPILDKIDRFLARPDPLRDGSSTMFVLADAGMGKTSLLIMLKLMHLNSFWPSNYDCQLLKLGEGTLAQLQSIQDPAHTILLLDSLDEDPSANKRCEERLVEVLRACARFHETTITCRTQYFPSNSPDPIERNGRIVIRGFRCTAYYLSPFSDEEVDRYLNKRFKAPWFGLKTHPDRERAGQLTKMMKSLRCRPMLLAHIQDFVEADRAYRYEYEMYETLVERWLVREVEKAHEPGKRDITVNALHYACTVLALAGQHANQQCFSAHAIETLGQEFGEVLHIEDLTYEYTGRSLLVRSDEGYRFSHRSFQEFLVAQCLIRHSDVVHRFAPQISDLLAEFLRQATALRGGEKARDSTIIVTIHAGPIKDSRGYVALIVADAQSAHRAVAGNVNISPKLLDVVTPHLPPGATVGATRNAAAIAAAKSRSLAWGRFTHYGLMMPVPGDDDAVIAKSSPNINVASLRERYGAASGGSTNEQQLMALAKDRDSRVRHAVASNLNATDAVLRSLSSGADRAVRIMVAVHPNVPDDALLALSTDDEETVREEVALNPKTPADVLATLSRDSAAAVRKGVALNPQTPRELLCRLATDPATHIRCAVLTNSQVVPLAII